MTTQPQAEAQATPISQQTERVLHDFVRDAVLRLSEKLKESNLEHKDETRWECGANGHFREHKKRAPRFWPMPRDEWLSSLPDYQTCIACLKSDVVIGPHLDQMVGTWNSANRLEANNILMSLVYAALDTERLAFANERFRSKWQDMLGLFGADQISFKTVAPLPYLVVPSFPLRLNNELALDRLTDDEVTRCHQVGVIGPFPPQAPLVYGDIAVGIRRTMFIPKLIRQGDEPHEVSKAGDEGTFGNRPLLRDDLVVDDVLSALRLFKRTQIHTTGHATWSDSYLLDSGTSFRVLRQWPYGGKFELLEDEVTRFLDLWRLLEHGAARFSFCLHRFNLAFDRGLLTDRIVDLVIAAEALLLGDLDDNYRGELRFRFALRAGKFIEHPNYGEHEIYRVMRNAYDARSAIVHGGLPKEVRLPNGQSSNLSTFIDAVEELVRLGLRKALSMTGDGRKLRKSEYWDTLLFA